MAAPTDSSDLDGYRSKVVDWQSKFTPDQPQYKLAQEMLTILQDPKNKTLLDVINAIEKQVYPDLSGGGKDVYLRYLGLSVDEMHNLSQIFSIVGQRSLSTPLPTSVDQKCMQAYSWLNQTDDPQDQALLQKVIDLIEELGSSNMQLPFLQQRAQVVMNSSLFTLANLKAQNQFKKLTQSP